jgi:dienelactone hydrolase
MSPVFLRPVAVAAVLLLQFVQPSSAASEQADTFSRTNLLQWQDKKGKIRAVRTTSDWHRRKNSILAAMQEVMGPLPSPEKRCPLDVQIEEDVDCGSYLRRFITYASEPGSRVPAYLLIPKSVLEKKKRAPAILCFHQTHPAGQKVVVGLGDSPNDEYGVELVKAGYVCVAPAYPLLANYAPDLKTLGYSSGTMKAIWDNIRALDLLESLPFVKKGKFGAIGHSLGGHNGIYTAAFDDRIKVVVSNCGLDSYSDYMNGDIRGWTGERYMPRLLDYSPEKYPFDFPEVIAAIAPRRCLIVAPTGDTNFKWKSVDRVAAAARPIFKLYRVPTHLMVEHPDSGHVFLPEMRQQAYRLFDQVLK